MVIEGVVLGWELVTLSVEWCSSGVSVWISAIHCVY